MMGIRVQGQQLWGQESRISNKYSFGRTHWKDHHFGSETLNAIHVYMSNKVQNARV